MKAMIGLKQVIGLILAVMFITFMIWLYVKLSGAVYIGVEQQEAVGALEKLATKINKIIMTDKANNTAFFSYAILPIKISDEYTIVAFNKYENSSHDCCPKEEWVEKPKECGKRRTCLCLYSPGKHANFADNKLKRCIKLSPRVSKVLSFYYLYSHYKETYEKRWPYSSSELKELIDNYKASPTGSRIEETMAGCGYEKELPNGYPAEAYAYFFLYGECDGWWWDHTFPPSDLYVELLRPANSTEYIAYIAQLPKQGNLSINSRIERVRQCIEGKC